MKIVLIYFDSTVYGNKGNEVVELHDNKAYGMQSNHKFGQKEKER